MRSKLVVLLVFPHFQRVRTNELLLLMKWTWRWWLFILFKVMYFHIYFFIHFYYQGTILPFPFTEYFCRTVNKSVGAGINTLMSISDGLGPSIFCRKMEEARPMREEMDGRVVYFPPESALLPLMLYLSTVIFLIVLWLGVQTIMFPARKKYK